MNEVIEYLNSKKIEYKVSGDEAVLKCPYCNRPKLYLNTKTQLFHCFYCEARNPESPFVKGHFRQLQQTWGDLLNIQPAKPATEEKDPDFTDLATRYHNAIWKNKKALKYLLQRGITKESIKKFKLGFVHFEKQDWISIPIFEKGTAKLIKYRKLPPDTRPDLEKYKRETNGKSILFNSDCIEKFDEIFVVEGELSALSMIQAGYENVVGITGGAGTLKSDWYDQLVMKKKIILIFDADEAGQKAAKEVWATRLGVDKCYNVVLPAGEDVDSFLLKYNKDRLDECINKATKFKVDGIYSLAESLYLLYERGLNQDTVRLPLPWDSVNNLLDGGIEKNWLVVVGGIPGVGKTSFVINMLHYYSRKYNIPSLFFCLEMPESYLALKVIQLEKDLTYQEIDPTDALAYLTEMEDIPMYFGYKSKITVDVFYNTLKAARDRFGIGVAAFDNLQRMIRSDKESDFAKASGAFKDIAMDLNIPFILISQPRKINAERSITYDDLKGSGAIGADSDIVILLNRKRVKESNSHSAFEEKTIVIVDKSRYAKGGKTLLRFEGDKSKFTEWT